MRAAVYRSFGPPEEVLEIDDVDTPEPGAGEVRVRITLATIHNHDLMTVRGQYGYRPELPARAGTEAVGVIDALGEGVTDLEIGQRVVAGTSGVWAEYVTMPADRVVPVDDAVPDEAAAKLGSIQTPERRAQLMGELRERIADGTVGLPVAAVHDLDHIADAVRASGEAGRGGKVLLRP